MAFLDRFPERCAEAIAALERESSAEVVVVVAPRSGSYSDADLGWGIAGAMVTLALILHGPWLFHPDLVLLNVFLAGLFCWWVSRRSRTLRRWLTSSARRRDQAEDAAARVFLERAVSATRARTGVLVYVSLLERVAVVRPDYGVEGRVPGAFWNEVRDRLGRVDDEEDLEAALFEILARMREVLSEALPGQADDQDELPDRPVMLT